MSRIHAIAIATLVAITTGCALAPASGSTTSTSEIDFDGFVDGPGLKVRLEAFDVGTNKFGALKTVTAATTPSFAAGAICPNSPALYRYTGKIDLHWPIWWKWVGDGTYEARVRAFKVTSSGELPVFFTTNPNAGLCMSQHAFNSTCDFNNVAVSKCGFKIYEATVKGTGPAPWNN
jgi:hypothetical protein